MRRATNDHHFISYSSADASDFAIKLALELQSRTPAFHLWLDKNDIAEAATLADELLMQSAQNYAALDSKGLAACGLALCGEAARLSDAISAYRAARAINKDAGVVKRVLRLFDALAMVDTEGILKDVRPAAAGE